MQTIYKSCSPKYTDEQVKRLSGVTTFVSFARLLNLSIYDAIGKKPNEKIVGMVITTDGVQLYIENEEQ